MKGWCPRCDAVREAEGACPECQAPLVELDERPPARPAPRPDREQEAAATEVAAVVSPPRARLRVAMVVAAAVLVGMAFVAGRSTGGTAATASRSTSATTQTTGPPAQELQRQLGWRSKPSDGITVEAVSISRVPARGGGFDASNGDNAGSVTFRVAGLGGSRRALGLTNVRLVDAGGGVFASPESTDLTGVDAVPLQRIGQTDRYRMDLGPTPAVDTLDSIGFDGVLLSASADGRGQLELASGGSWPSRPPLRAVEPSAGSVDVPLLRADGSTPAAFRLRVASAFVGAGRAVVVLSFDQEVAGRGIGAFPVTANLRDGRRLVCSRQTFLGQGRAQVSPLLVVDCPTSPAASLTVDLAGGVDAVRIDAKLSD
ncbi:MAG TPA: hypothetical protein VE776_05230 [Actinomycetota bacterium]|jgi:hypothetical protein|nr:hypothetical protein [Actinomycetota bacterium]